MCAGGLELIPCSRAGHVYRTKVVWHEHIANETILNEYRVAEVWMDQYKHIFFEMAGNYTVSAFMLNSMLTSQYKLLQDIQTFNALCIIYILTTLTDYFSIR